jgi:NAD(P)-dependent dehydrogenase (short-subunit alcohol dehydrogenase family)
MTRKVLVTGYLGGIGSAIFEKLERHSWNVEGFDVSESTVRKPIPDPEGFTHIVAAHGLLNIPGTSTDSMWKANYRSLTEWADGFLAGANTFERKCFIAITSNSADIPRRNSMEYCASKAAADMAMRVYNRENVHRGVEFYSLALGPVMTERTEYLYEKLGPGALENHLSRIPVGFMMRPEDVASWVLFILDNPAAKWASGTTLRLDGGEL